MFFLAVELQSPHWVSVLVAGLFSPLIQAAWQIPKANVHTDPLIQAAVYLWFSSQFHVSVCFPFALFISNSQV